MSLMDWMPMFVALVALTGAIWQGRRIRRDRHDQLKHSVELFSAMPDDLQNREAFGKYVDDEISHFLDKERTKLNRTLVVAAYIFGAALTGIGIAVYQYFLTLPERESDSLLESFSEEVYRGALRGIGIGFSIGGFLFIAGLTAGIIRIKSRRITS
ncbi:hypothetical protein ACTWP5_16620 [Streptomyces sp. 4N509B]|uniref:hypothetical protein n=1 Tax=Streptomyces sp. 4N509B TaxID=3457413 RepID=UPI003FD0A4DC